MRSKSPLPIPRCGRASTPGNQAHVTNAKDDPLQLAADAATAVAFGFDEIETTMRVSRNAWSNALACAVGGAVGRWGTLFQCSSEEAEELRIGMAGFTSYAETVSVYGTEKTFIDGDDTPWSKAFLAAAYASRGIKMRCTSGAGSELLMGFHESKSLLYLEARCLCLQRGMGVQGTQNGGIDGAPLTATDAGRHPRADGGKPDRCLARPRMRVAATMRARPNPKSASAPRSCPISSPDRT